MKRFSVMGGHSLPRTENLCCALNRIYHTNCQILLILGDIFVLIVGFYRVGKEMV
ncbi:hypothetical protein [Moraxella lacunata]|uniref:hypothetical protein n=1 Tax=Moraxella lacunata TaxID=477 RepID=UPI003EE41592